MLHPLPFPDLDRPLRLLVVDDQEFDRKMIASRLREVAPADAIIVEAAGGQATLDAIRGAAVPFDCVLLDMNLPDIHGVDLTTMILGINPELSVVMITVEADMDKALKCIKAGAEDFLIKGEYTNIGMFRAVRYAMERRHAAVENYRLSEALKRERELSAAQKEFIHLVSHEFRTPIAIISGAVQLIAAKEPLLYEGKCAPQFKKIDTSIDRLIQMLDNVLRLSMVEEGKTMFAPALFDLVASIQTTIEDFEPSRIDLAIDARQSLDYLGDQRLIEYALHNVISNAVKYSPADSQVSVSLHVTDAAIEVAVSDKGAGMSEAMLARLGEKFYRGSHTSHIEGTGLGLHLAKRFMEYHGGNLIFASEQGKGTTVRMVFPNVAA